MTARAEILSGRVNGIISTGRSAWISIRVDPEMLATEEDAGFRLGCLMEWTWYPPDVDQEPS